MSSKRFQGLRCVYCTVRPSQVGDHVFAREFFAIEQRANLPQVPSCHECNTAKSKVEHYLTTVLPFAGRHKDAKQMLSEFVPKRLAKNKALDKSLREGAKPVMLENPTGQRDVTLSIPILPGALENWTSYLAKGLLWHHWQTLLEGGGDVEAYSLTESGESHIFSYIFDRPAPRRVVESLGNGTFRYSGVQIPEKAQLSVWVIEPYGGAILAGDEAGPNNVSRFLCAFTGARGSIAELLARGGA